MIMAWVHPELYHRVLTVSGTFVNQQWPHSDAAPHGAWELHEHLIPNSPAKPLRIWMEVGDKDNYSQSDNMHDWVAANENMAKVLTAKGYHYQFVFARNAGHTDRAYGRRSCPRPRIHLAGLSHRRKEVSELPLPPTAALHLAMPYSPTLAVGHVHIAVGDLVVRELHRLGVPQQHLGAAPVAWRIRGRSRWRGRVRHMHMAVV